MSTARSKSRCSGILPGSRPSRRQNSTSDIHCVTTWSRYDNQWEGLATRDLLDACHPRDEAKYVVLHSHDGYTTNLALEDLPPRTPCSRTPGRARRSSRSMAARYGWWCPVLSLILLTNFASYSRGYSTFSISALPVAVRALAFPNPLEIGRDAARPVAVSSRTPN